MLAVAALGSTACYSVPPGKSAVASVEIEGAPHVDTEDLEERIATQESPKFLGLFRGVVYDYEVFDRYALQRDMNRIERYLHARGYYEAKVYAARVVPSGDRVRVTIDVQEGAPVTVASVTLVPNEPVDEGTLDRVRTSIAAKLPIGDRLDEDKLAEAEKDAEAAMTGNGYATAKVTKHAEVDLATHTARVSFAVEVGPLAKFGTVTFEGLGEIPENKVRRIFGVEEGVLYSSDTLDEGRQALLDLGVFGSVEVEQGLEEATKTGRVPIVVKAQPGKLRAVLVGGGFELDQLKTDLHTQVGWQNSNFLGGLRKLDLRYKPGVVLYPTRFPDLLPPTDPLYEHRMSATLRQPAFFEKRTTGLLRAEYNVYPVLLPTPTEEVLGYHELRGEVGVERRFLKHLFVAPEYDVQANLPFDYLGKIERVETILVSYVELGTRLDYRDDTLKPRKGFLLGNQLQLAGGILQGDADDIKTQPEARVFVPLPRKVTLAFRASVGFVFPFNYGKAAQENFANPGPSRSEAADRDYQIYFFRGFFGGGPSSNRGYPLRGIGPQDAISYLSPAGQSTAAFGCNPNEASCQLPTGGLSLWELSAEVRFVVSGPFAMATFCDAGDVSPFVADIRPAHPHLSCGGGARYDTPVGPIRLDVGYRIPGLQYPADDPFERSPDDFLGVPIAVAFGIGEAF